MIGRMYNLNTKCFHVQGNNSTRIDWFWLAKLCKNILNTAARFDQTKWWKIEACPSLVRPYCPFAGSINAVRASLLAFWNSPSVAPAAYHTRPCPFRFDCLAQAHVHSRNGDFPRSDSQHHCNWVHCCPDVARNHLRGTPSCLVLDSLPPSTVSSTEKIAHLCNDLIGSQWASKSQLSSFIFPTQIQSVAAHTNHQLTWSDRHQGAPKTLLYCPCPKTHPHTAATSALTWNLPERREKDETTRQLTICGHQHHLPAVN